MRTLGIDVAAEPAKTALATIDWNSDGAALVDLQLGVTNTTIIDAIGCADKVGIDCPLGWPDHFTDFIVGHRRRTLTPGAGERIKDREHLAYRVTDLYVWRNTKGPLPLSVSTDRIGRAAMRIAGVLAAIEMAGEPVDRAGSGRIVEVYPAAALRQWGLERPQYKANVDARSGLVNDLVHRTRDWLHIPADLRETSIESDDLLDAVVAALNARAASIPRGVVLPGEHEMAAASSEGWIAVPGGALEDLDPRRLA